MTDQYADFERDGEQAVRDNLARGAYMEPRANLARAWLQRNGGAKNDAFAAEQIQIARSSKNAAWTAAVAAIVAALIATISAGIAYYSVKGGH